jgi:hypothetical protein
MENPGSSSKVLGGQSLELLCTPLPSVLIVSELVRRAIPEGKKEEDGELFYTVTVDDKHIRHENASLGFCNLIVGKRLEAISIIEFKASYVYGFVSEEDLQGSPEFQRLVEELVKSTVWPRFRDLFALTINQADQEFPLLPSRPNRVIFAEPKTASATEDGPSPTPKA